jgi:hypothetical protein
VGKPEGNRTLGRHRCRWEDNIKLYLQEFGWREWTGLIWLRLGTCSCECGNKHHFQKFMVGLD